MGIALLAISGLFQKLPGFHASRPAPSPRPAIRLHHPWPARAAIRSVPPQKVTPLTAKVPSLRVLMVHEAGDGPRNPSRIVISGRMSDVCAELDRLAALENSR